MFPWIATSAGGVTTVVFSFLAIRECRKGESTKRIELLTAFCVVGFIFFMIGLFLLA